MKSKIWQQITNYLQEELSTNEFNMWISPLECRETKDQLIIDAPNNFVLQWVQDKYINKIKTIANKINYQYDIILHFEKNKSDIDITEQSKARNNHFNSELQKIDFFDDVVQNKVTTKEKSDKNQAKKTLNLNPNYIFDNFIEGTSNKIAKATATKSLEDLGKIYNPLFLYGRTGLGKTHLLHAVGNKILSTNKDANIIYVHSERFVQKMVKAIRENDLDRFKNHFKNATALLIDDIQFLAGKKKSQEEFLYIFNTLFDKKIQIMITGDRNPSELDNFDERLKSRLVGGLAVAIDPPELVTRISILIEKANEHKIKLSNDVAIFMARHLHANVRELEGALNRVIAHVNFTNNDITVGFVKEVLQDLLVLKNAPVSILQIQEVVAKYYRLTIKDLITHCRKRHIARPRQLAMLLTKELTTYGVTEIGYAFGGRDHSTVIHACRKMQELKEKDINIKEDYRYLMVKLSS